MNEFEASTDTVQQMEFSPAEAFGKGLVNHHFDVVRPGEAGWEFKGKTSQDVFLFNFAPYHSQFAMNSDQRKHMSGLGMTYNVHPVGTEIHETDLYQPGECLIVEFSEGLFCGQLAEEFGVNSLSQSYMSMGSQRIINVAHEIKSALWAAKFGNAPPALFIEGLSLALSAAIAEDIANELGRSIRSEKIEAYQIHRVQDYIEASLEEQISLDRIAAAVGLSKFRLARAYKSATGQGVHQYVIARRLDRARSMLRESDLTLSEVSYATGFSSQSHLTAAFRRNFGVTPGSYRKSAQS